MTPLAALLAVAVAAGPSGAKRTGLDVSNAARAKAGLLPRKTSPRAEPRGPYATVRTPAPTYLPEPAPLAGSTQVVDGHADASPQVATAEADASRAPVPQLVVARGPVQTRRLPEAPASSLPRVIAEEEPQAAAAAPRSVPDEIGTLRAQASGIATEITISLRFEP